jgi:hypothetical protein
MVARLGCRRDVQRVHRRHDRCDRSAHARIAEAMAAGEDFTFYAQLAQDEADTRLHGPQNNSTNYTIIVFVFIATSMH